MTDLSVVKEVGTPPLNPGREKFASTPTWNTKKTPTGSDSVPTQEKCPQRLIPPLALLGKTGMQSGAHAAHIGPQKEWGTRTVAGKIYTERKLILLPDQAARPRESFKKGTVRSWPEESRLFTKQDFGGEVGVVFSKGCGHI
ncbi:hypothetical protein FE257_003462 [Aspergillus nanangensis]|uniref:Uncharacterized protein n=1 Tax=Aspergillus nanangensis TaxID=2582783 RepID=A0AAD4CBL1_ASPNN|nr:hypothetical protein FE257_003462 [Aspergillus nanangensis]